MTSTRISTRAAVMVVEDDDDVRLSIVQVLDEEGYETSQAGDGAAALSLLRTPGRPLPGLIVLDMMMPKMDGREFLLHQSADPALAPIPVLVLSASESAKVRAVVPGVVTEFLRKPFALEKLLSLVEHLSSGRASGATGSLPTGG